MTTLPDVPAKPTVQPKEDPRSLNATDRAALQSTLLAARAEAQRGREKDCFARLQKARKIILRKGN